MNAEQAVDKVNTPLDQWPETLPMLMTFLGVETEDALPELFLKIAKADKKEEQFLIQNMLRAHITHPNSYGDQPPIVTPSMAKMMIKFNFASEDQDNLSRGLQPFIINNGNAEQ